MGFTMDELLGVGLYTPAEAARYARITTSMMTRWVHGSRKGRPVVHPVRDDDRDRIVTFVDFVQVLAIRQLRRQKPAPSLEKIRKAYEEAVERYDVRYPFAYSHKCFYDGKEIWIELPWRKHGDDELFTQMTGRGRGQSMIREIAEIYIDRIEFEGEDHIASKFTLWRDELGAVTMDPAKRFGEPLLESGYTFTTIAEAYRQCRDVKTVAEEYDISREEIVVALRCEDYLEVQAAA
jgi:uncharacterized protein (DUF433 family)